MTLESWHALDAPLTNPDAWFDQLELGICTACGHEACRGEHRWWHADGRRLCPDRATRTPHFSPDTEGPR